MALYALLVMLIAVFGLEVFLSPSTSGALAPPISVLIGLGGLEHDRVAAGEYWRIVTAALLHGDLLHLALNGVALFMAGSVLERMVGRGWMLALFVLGALGGSAASLLANPANTTTVGASGAIMGMLAAALFVILRLPRGPARTGLMLSLAQILVPSLLPLAATGAGGAKVDVAAHAGGALVGAVAGLGLLAIWPRWRGYPRGVVLAWIVVLAGVVAIAVGARGVVNSWAETGPTNLLAPEELFTDLAPDKLTREQAEALVVRHPADPRVRFVAGYVAAREDALEDARRHLEVGLSRPALLARLARAGVPIELWLHELLAAVAYAEGDEVRAREMMAPVCGSSVATNVRPGLREELCAPSTAP